MPILHIRLLSHPSALQFLTLMDNRSVFLIPYVAADEMWVTQRSELKWKMTV
jgi:hypothetical protein